MPTTNPVPSADPADLLFNAGKLDEVVNGQTLTYTDRLGHPRMTVAGAVDSLRAIVARGAWATATAYATKDVVQSGGDWYICVAAHTSGATFAGDLAANWRVYQGVTSAELSSAGGADQVGYLHPAFGTVMRALSGRMDELVHVTDFMSDAQRADVLSGSAPTLDSSAAMAAAWAYVQTRGGTLMLPAGGYMWNAQITLAVTAPHNIKVLGWGARIYSGAAVTGAAVRVLGSFNEYQLDIEGLTFDHRGNTTAGGCIALVGAHCVHVSRITLEFSSVKAGYTFIELATSNPGASEDDYNAFWNKITGCSTRKRTGADPGAIAYGVRIRGTANATTIRDNVLSHCDYGVYGEPAGTTQNLANAVLIEGNHFETLNVAAVHVQMNPGTLGPTGWRLAFNRVETTATFFSLATGGAAALPHSAPPFLIGNYCTTGSVTNWIVNPTSYPVSAQESRYPGFGPAVDSVMWQAGSFKIVFPTGGDLYLNNASGASDYTLGKLFFGTYNVRVNPGDGKLYIKNGQPANATDGVVAGTQT